MLTFIEAIARQEGFYLKGSLPQRRDNPGDIEEGAWAQAHGALPPDGSRFAAWPTEEAGFAADRGLLSEHYLGMTVAQALDKYAPPKENQTNAYIANVCAWTGLTPETVLTEANLG